MFYQIALIIVFAFATQCMSHVYGPGTCPYVVPMKEFEMTKFLGRWYAIEKTGTESTCLTYDIKKGEKYGEYLLEQTSERSEEHLNAAYVFSYHGKITTYNDKSSKMRIQFPLSIGGSASFDVITTDYRTHAVIHTCQNILFVSRQSATLLSRTKEIGKNLLKKMHLTIDENIQDDLNLRTIRQDKCYETDNQILFKVKSNLASSFNLIQRVDENVEYKDVDKKITYEPQSFGHDESTVAISDERQSEKPKMDEEMPSEKRTVESSEKAQSTKPIIDEESPNEDRVIDPSTVESSDKAQSTKPITDEERPSGKRIIDPR